MTDEVAICILSPTTVTFNLMFWNAVFLYAHVQQQLQDTAEVVGTLNGFHAREGSRGGSTGDPKLHLLWRKGQHLDVRCCHLTERQAMHWVAIKHAIKYMLKDSFQMA